MKYPLINFKKVNICLRLLIFFGFCICPGRSLAQETKPEQVSFQSGDIQLSGILFLPKEKGKCPGVVILHGSGPDEGLGYEVYAREFRRAGIATLVYDKRGSGKSGGDWLKRPFKFLAEDALSAVRYLQSRSEIDSHKIGLWGISQGAWTAAFAAARSKDVNFVISVGGNSVSPAQQETWHKDNMYRSLGYSEKARDTARKFWLMVFDWLVLVDEGKFPLPEKILEGARSGASVGMNYDPLPDWEKVTQPILLINGEYDELSPPSEAISRISRVLSQNGNKNFTYKIFPRASHTITTKSTGLIFDWDNDFASGYFELTTNWIKGQTNPGFKIPQDVPEPVVANPDFDDSGIYGKLNWFGRAYPQLILMIVFPLIFLVGTLSSIISLISNKSFPALFIGLTCLLNLLLSIGFYFFLATSIYPQGLALMPSYSIPLWQKLLPVLGNITIIMTIFMLISFVKNWVKFNKLIVLFAIAAVIFPGWLFYWNLLGVPF